MADAIFPQARKRSPLFVLMAEDGRFATYDTGTGAYLTPNWALAYWGRSSSRVTSRHFDHGNGTLAFTSKLFRFG